MTNCYIFKSNFDIFFDTEKVSSCLYYILHSCKAHLELTCTRCTTLGGSISVLKMVVSVTGGQRSKGCSQSAKVEVLAIAYVLERGPGIWSASRPKLQSVLYNNSYACKAHIKSAPTIGTLPPKQMSTGALPLIFRTLQKSYQLKQSNQMPTVHLIDAD